MLDCLFCLVFYIFGFKDCVLEKVWGFVVDVIFFDFEDVVLFDEKENVCEMLVVVLVEGGYVLCYWIVWINGFDIEWGCVDVEVVVVMDCDVVLLFKVNGFKDVDVLVEIIGDLLIWVMMEMLLGVINVVVIVVYLKIEGFVLGINDFVKDLNSCKLVNCELLFYSL